MPNDRIDVNAAYNFRMFDNQRANTLTPMSQGQTIGAVMQDSAGWQSLGFAGIFALPTIGGAAWRKSLFGKDALNGMSVVNSTIENTGNFRVKGFFNNWQYSKFLDEVGRYKGLLNKPGYETYKSAVEDAAKLFKGTQPANVHLLREASLLKAQAYRKMGKAFNYLENHGGNAENLKGWQKFRYNRLDKGWGRFGGGAKSAAKVADEAAAKVLQAGETELGFLAKAGKMGISKGGMAAMAVIQLALDAPEMIAAFKDSKKEGFKQLVKSAVVAGASAAGYAAGMAAGAALGAEIGGLAGTVVPGLGNIVGVVVGCVVGGLVGWLAKKVVGKNYTEKQQDNQNKAYKTEYTPEQKIRLSVNALVEQAGTTGTDSKEFKTLLDEHNKWVQLYNAKSKPNEGRFQEATAEDITGLIALQQQAQQAQQAKDDATAKAAAEEFQQKADTITSLQASDYQQKLQNIANGNTNGTDTSDTKEPELTEYQKKLKALSERLVAPSPAWTPNAGQYNFQYNPFTAYNQNFNPIASSQLGFNWMDYAKASGF